MVEFRSAVDAVRCAVEVQDAMVERNAGVPEDRRIVFRIGIHIGDVVEESDGDLMGDGVNVAARLEGVCAPGAICLSEDAYRQVKGRLELAVTDLGETKLKNIAEPIRTYSLHVGAVAAPRTAANKPAVPAPKPVAEKPSIAVLPFQNMSGDAEQEYFVDGLVEDVITGLSRIKSLLVIARNSSFVYKGKAVDIRQVGRDLGARYVLEGSIRKGGNKLRITAQLIEAETGAHLWADRFDGDLGDVFDFQDRVTERVVGVIEPSMLKSEIERSRRKPPDSLAAYDLYLQALPHLTLPIPAEARIAAPLLQDALRLEPNYPAAEANLAHCHEIFFHFGGLDPADRSAGLKHAETVLASRTDDATALAKAGFVMWQLGQDFVRASAAIERSLSYNPCCMTALLWGGLVYAFCGEPAKATEFAQRALRLSPFDPAAWMAHLSFGHAAVYEDRYDDAVSHYEKALHLSPQLGAMHTLLAIALALAGRADEASPVVTKALEVDPNFRIGRVLTMFKSPAFADKLRTGARLAGLPE
ncbi:MAG TPA: tetratricopeptide repeat protein [Roseiarcus sp.]|nr:tetratricopeptide repeat protein [Roseiarcus sp.]